LVCTHEKNCEPEGVPDFLIPHKVVVLLLGADHAHCFYGQVSGEGNHFLYKSKEILEFTDYAVQVKK
jgi:hypothetical protein